MVTADRKYLAETRSRLACVLEGEAFMRQASLSLKAWQPRCTILATRQRPIVYASPRHSERDPCGSCDAPDSMTTATRVVCERESTDRRGKV